MSETLSLLGYGLAYLALLTAVGSGLVAACARQLEGGVLLAPVVGFGAAAAVLTSATFVMPMKLAAWVLLLPGALVSLAVAVWVGRNRLRASARELGIPIAMVLVGLVIALLPGLLRGTEGPFALYVYDALGYIQSDEWLQEHTTGALPAADAARYDLVEVRGLGLVSDDRRIGVSAVNAAVASVFRTQPDQTTLALLAVLFSLTPLTVWVLARALGARQAAAAFGALFGLSPAIFSLVPDAALANLAGLALAPSALLLGIRWLTRGRWGELVLAAVLAGGVLAVYPEFVPPALVAAAVGLVALGISVWPRSRTRNWLQRLVVRVLLVVAAAIVVSPIGAERTLGYVTRIGSFIVTGLPGRYLTVESGWAWAFGVLHLYQLPRFDLFSGPKMVVAIGLPIVLALVLGLGMVRCAVRRTLFVLIPIGVAIGLGLVSYHRYQEGRCEYCLWKSLTFLLPFLAVGLALGFEQGIRLARGRSVLGLATRAGLAVVAACAVAALAWTNTRLVQATYYSPAAVPAELRDLTTHSDLPPRPALLVEGSDTSAAPPWTTPAMYYFARALDDARVSFVADEIGWSYLAEWEATETKYYSPNYEYVLTPFGGVRSDRKLLGARGSYALFERAPIDVTPVSTGWSFDPSDRSKAIPWVQKPFQLWVSNPGVARPVALELRLARPLDDQATLFFRKEGEPLGALRSPDGARLCIDLAARAGLTVVSVDPQFDVPPPAAIRLTESDPVPPPPKAIGLLEIRAAIGHCSKRLASPVPALQYGNGWQPSERDAQGNPFRWMGTEAELIIGEAGLERPPTRLRAIVGSLLVARRLAVMAGGAPIETVSLPPNGAAADLVVDIPGGEGAITIGLEAFPGAQSATAVNPADQRQLAVLFRDVELQAVDEPGGLG